MSNLIFKNGLISNTSGYFTLHRQFWQREQLEVARLQNKIANLRSDFHWKLVLVVCARYDALSYETLNTVTAPCCTDVLPAGVELIRRQLPPAGDSVSRR